MQARFFSLTLPISRVLFFGLLVVFSGCCASPHSIEKNSVLNNVEIGMTEGEVIKVAGPPKAKADCFDNSFLYYEKIWVWLNSGVVKGGIGIEEWEGPCYPYRAYQSVSFQ